MQQYFIAANPTDITAGDFNYDPLKVPENKLSDIFTHHVQMVDKLKRSCLYHKNFDGKVFHQCNCFH